MARKKRRLRGRNAQRREAYTMEKYDTRALHEEREYGLFWYAWLWKILRSVLIFMCSVLIDDVQAFIILCNDIRLIYLTYSHYTSN